MTDNNSMSIKWKPQTIFHLFLLEVLYFHKENGFHVFHMYSFNMKGRARESEREKFPSTASHPKWLQCLKLEPGCSQEPEAFHRDAGTQAPGCPLPSQVQ